MGIIKKDFNDILFDYALIRWVLRANAIRLWGHNDKVFTHVNLAHNEDLEVWLQFALMSWVGYKDTDLDRYKKLLSEFSKKAQKYNVKVLIVGMEIDLHSKYFTREGNILRKNVSELIKVARQNYSGLVTYNDWDGWWNVTNIDWEPMDIIFPQFYKGKAGEPVDDKEYLNALLNWKRKYPNKPFVNGEYGIWDYVKKEPKLSF